MEICLLCRTEVDRETHSLYSELKHLFKNLQFFNVIFIFFFFPLVGQIS